MPRKFLSGIDAGDERVTNVANPVSDNDAVNKQYVDARVPGVVVDDAPPTSTEVLWADTTEPGDAVVPSGGTAGQVLAKASGADYDTEWREGVVIDDAGLILATQVFG